jgi:hypothetical protein
MRVQEYSYTSLRYQTDLPGQTNPRLLKHLNDAGAEIVTIAEVPKSLEQVYLKLVENSA